MENSPEPDLQPTDEPFPVAPEETGLVASEDRELSEFSRCLTVRGPDGERFMVPVDGAANKAKMQVIVARMGKIIERSIKEAEDSDEPLNGMQLQRLTVAVSTYTDMAFSAYGDKKIGALGNKSELASLAIGMARASAEGISAAAANGFDKRLKQIMELGSVGNHTSGGRRRQSKDAKELVVEPDEQ